MDEKTQNGYIACTIFLVVSLLSGWFAIQNEFNSSGQLLWRSTGITAFLGILSFKYPNSVGQIAWRILKYLKKIFVDEKSDSHDYKPRGQTIQNSSHSVQANASHSGYNIINIGSSGENSRELEVYSPIHAMIVKINGELSRETALQLSGSGAWINASLIDHTKISEIFNQHGDKFRDRDLAMWFKIEKEIKTGNGFYLDKDRQEWFDYLEAKYNSLKSTRQKL